jgi:hypothetical protein
MIGRAAGVALLIVACTMGALGDPGPVKVISTKRDIFYFKVEKEFVGALIEVFDKHGNKVIEQHIDKKKVIVDFYYDQPGKYTIRVSNGTEEQIFVYEKFGPSHAERFAGDFVLVTDF